MRSHPYDPPDPHPHCGWGRGQPQKDTSRNAHLMYLLHVQHDHQQTTSSSTENPEVVIKGNRECLRVSQPAKYGISQVE